MSAIAQNDKLNDESDEARTAPFIRSAYNYSTDVASVYSGLVCPEPTLTQQHQAKETDINYIVQQFGVTGQLPQSLNMPTYADFDAVFDYQTAMNAIIQANQEFMTLPAEVRKQFNNSPAEFLDFIDNNPDPQKLVDLGIAEIISTGRADPSAAPAD